MSALPPLAAILHVALGGAAGAVLRYQTGRWLAQALGPQAVATFPWATLAVNALGSLLMGVLAAWLARSGAGGGAAGGAFGTENLRLLLGVGLLGGFTTFSAFSLEVVLLIERGQLSFAALYAVLSFSLGIAGLMSGLWLTRALT